MTGFDERQLRVGPECPRIEVVGVPPAAAQELEQTAGPPEKDIVLAPQQPLDCRRAIVDLPKIAALRVGAERSVAPPDLLVEQRRLACSVGRRDRGNQRGDRDDERQRATQEDLHVGSPLRRHVKRPQ
jgi:hypothetical protein